MWLRDALDGLELSLSTGLMNALLGMFFGLVIFVFLAWAVLR
jgi:hypothetical protein